MKFPRATRLFVRINGETHYLWRAVDHEGEVLEGFVTKRRDRRAALKFLKRAMNVIGTGDRQECGGRLNNRAENSHQPFRRKEGTMSRFRDVKTLQKFAAVHASVHNLFNLQRHLNNRKIFKRNRTAVLDEWRQLAA